MEEPSVLDYVKAKLAFWKQSSIHIPPPEDEVEDIPDSTPERYGSGDASATLVDHPAKPASEPFSTAGLALALGSLAVAVLAQSFLEPPNRTVPISAFLYVVAAVLVGVAFYKNYVTMSQPAAEMPADSDLTFRWEGMAAGLFLMIVVFFLFGSKEDQIPTFGFLNSSLWLLSIGYIAWSFWQPSQRESIFARMRRLLASHEWQITVTRWGVLLLVSLGIILFFRFYRLDSLPAEMVSDHAEKLLDVNDVLNGDYRVFFPRNTGREAFQFYWTALMTRLFDTGVSFMALKLGTVLGGLLTLFYMYRLGNLIANRWVALLAVLFAGFSYWANIQSRIGLRFPLYPMFLAPVLFHLVRGLRNSSRNDFIWAGLWLGIGLHGYTSFRIVPFVIVVGMIIYISHHRSSDARKSAFLGLLIVALVSLAVFMPLLRFTIDHPDLVAFRSLTRLSGMERPLPGSPVEIFFKNTWNALVMFFWDNGDVWVHSIPHRPAMDVIAAALYFLGSVLVVLRWIRSRNWIDLFLLVSIPLLLLPSILSLAFPNENPNLNRTAGAYIPAFMILAIGLESLLQSVRRSLPDNVGVLLASGVGLLLVIFSAFNNYDILFNQFDVSFRASSWNTSEMGQVIRDFDRSLGRAEDARVLAFPYWVDTRLVGINAGYPTMDTGIDVSQIASTASSPRAKLFLVNPQDSAGLAQLRSVYPEGRFWMQSSRTPDKEFLVFYVPPREDMIEDGVEGDG